MYLVALAVAALSLARGFLDILALGLFGYYATRPIRDRIDEAVDSDGLAAGLTITTVLLPVFALVVYTGLQVLQRIRSVFDESVVSMLASWFPGLKSIPAAGWTDLQSPIRTWMSPAQLVNELVGSGLGLELGVLQTLVDTLLVVALAVTLSYALLYHDDELADGFARIVGGRDTTVFGYARAVDDDLESVFFGNLLFVVVMSGVATVTYGATNVVAPEGIQVPMVFALGFMTGIASLIPIVVGKVVYVPVVAYLGLQAVRSGGGGLLFVGGVLVVYVLVLDLLPQSFLQPYVSGRQLDTLLLLFAYILGPMAFGWYGFFLMPIVFVLVLEAARVVLPELLHGDPLRQTVDVADAVGADPKTVDGDADAGTGEPGDGSDDAGGDTEGSDVESESGDGSVDRGGEPGST